MLWMNFILPTYFSTFYGSSPELWHFPQSLWLSEPNTEISYKLSENHIKMSKIGEFQDSRQIPATPNPTVLIYLRPFQSNILFENSQNQIESVWNISMIFARKKSSTFLFRTFWITFERMKWALSLMGSHVEEQIFIFPPDGKVYNVKFCTTFETIGKGCGWSCKNLTEPTSTYLEKDVWNSTD